VPLPGARDVPFPLATRVSIRQDARVRVNRGVFAGAAIVVAALVLGGCSGNARQTAESSPTPADARTLCVQAMEGLKLGPTFTLTDANFAPYSHVAQISSSTAPTFSPDQPVALCNITNAAFTATSDGLEANVLAVVAGTSWWPGGQGFAGG